MLYCPTFLWREMWGSHHYLNEQEVQFIRFESGSIGENMPAEIDLLECLQYVFKFHA